MGCKLRSSIMYDESRCTIYVYKIFSTTSCLLLFLFWFIFLHLFLFCRFCNNKEKKENENIVQIGNSPTHPTTVLSINRFSVGGPIANHRLRMRVEAATKAEEVVVVWETRKREKSYQS